MTVRPRLAAGAVRTGRPSPTAAKLALRLTTVRAITAAVAAGLSLARAAIGAIHRALTRLVSGLNLAMGFRPVG